MSDDDVKHARAKQIESAIKRDDEMIDKVLKGISDIADAVGKLTKRMDALESGHLPGAGLHVRGKTVVDRGDPGAHEPRHDDHGKMHEPGDPKAVVADVVADAADPNQALFGHGDRRHDAAFWQAQSEGDRVAMGWGARCTPPLHGEQLLDYRRRLLRPWMKYSSQFKGVDIDEVNEPLLTPVEKSVLADAWAAASSNASAPEDTLREVQTIDSTGRRISTFYGQPRTWMQQFSGNRRRVVKFNTAS
jgi:hypothetical protein